ncbi:MAG: spermidine synthase [Betaproteobacteria bacterium]
MKRFIAVVVAVLLAACAGVTVHEEKSQYSHLRVVDFGSYRSLYFGEKQTEIVQTVIERERPHRLLHSYAQTMTAGFLYRPAAESMLLVGLGGGALVRYLNHGFPALRLDVVEIDPAIVRVARDWFGTREGPRTRIFVADGHDYLRRSSERYDIILLDAYLHPGPLTDATGYPLTLKSSAFYRTLHERLRPEGVVLFNLIDGRDGEAYLASIRSAFAAVQVFRVPGGGNQIVVAKPAGAVPDDATLRANAARLDAGRDQGFTFREILARRG